MTTAPEAPGMTLAGALVRNFLGNAPEWYKLTIVGFLLLNPLVLWVGGAQGATLAGWLLLVEFIFTLAMALKCYPLQPGGLLAIEAVALGLTTPQSVYNETLAAFPVVLMLMFMVAGIYFLKEQLLFMFTKILLGVRSQLALAMIVCLTSAALAAFLDALTVLAMLITIGTAFYQVFHRYASDGQPGVPYDVSVDEAVPELHRTDLDAFRAYLRGLIMHGAVGTALGGVMTQVGQPQNLLIAKQADWNFAEFFVHIAPVSIPVLCAGLGTCVLLEKLRWFGFGTPLPPNVREVLLADQQAWAAKRTNKDVAVLLVQGIAATLLIVALALHLAEVGIVGLMIIILATAFTGVTDEQRLGKAFEAALPFTALLVVFFAIVAVLHDQHLFEPIVTAAFHLQGEAQAAAFYLANALLSSVSDNVFVATIYITEVKAALLDGTISREQFDALAIAINTGTNIPSIATPNGQAAFLFLLTSALAPLIRLSYGRMVWMALPYTVTMTLTGLWAVMVLL